MGDAVVPEKPYADCYLIEEEQFGLERDELPVCRKVGIYGFLRTVLKQYLFWMVLVEKVTGDEQRFACAHELQGLSLVDEPALLR